MKKLFAWVLILALLCAPLTACGSRQPSPSGGGPAGAMQPEELSEISHKLLADWYGYISRCEYLYGDMLWALSYLEPFFEDHSWNSLQAARAALCLAERRVELIDPPETVQMAFDDYDKLIQSGADVGPVQISIDSIPSLKSSLLLDYRLYRDHLNSPGDEFFLTYQLDCFESWASLMMQIYELYLQTCAIETDYVLLAVDNEESESRFIEAITEKCPQINARRAGLQHDPDALLEDLAVLTNELDRLADELSVNVGQSQANLDLFLDASEIDASGGADALAQYVSSMSADATVLTGFPTALPYPDWWYEQEDEDFLYTWENGEDGEKASIMPGDAIETPPDQYYITWTGVSLDEYQAYLNILGGYGIPAEFVTEKEGTHTAFFQLQTGSFALIWEETEVSFLTMDGSVCFAPPWYVIYSRQDS